MGSIVERVTSVVEPVLVPLGLDLVDVEHGGGFLRVTVERHGDGSVDMSQLESATHAISRALDSADPIPGRYTLEVSSPGLERPLKTPAHFRRAVGADIAVKLVAGAEGERRLTGKLTDADDEVISVLTDAGEARSIAFADIATARTVFVWGPGPKPGKSPAKTRPAAPVPVAQKEVTQ